jgi:hypothetical protein
MANLIGKNVLIVDEVDDTRTTLEYAVRELQKDVETASEKLGRTGESTNFSIFVLHVRPYTLGCSAVRWADTFAEQRQDKEGPPSSRDDGLRQLSRSQNRWRCLDMLSLGSNVSTWPSKSQIPNSLTATGTSTSTTSTPRVNLHERPRLTNDHIFHEFL